MSSLQVAVILPAAGSSQRFIESCGKGPKLQQLMDGRPVLLHTLELFLNRPEVIQTILVVPPDQVEDFHERFGAQLGFHDVTVVPGGKERWASVQQGMAAVSPLVSHIAVHDAARPVTSQACLDRVFSAAAVLPAVAPGLMVRDTLKRVGETQTIETQADTADLILGGDDTGEPVVVQPITETVDRAGLVGIQTPQIFAAEVLQNAYEKLADGQIDASGVTDDAALVERCGETVHVVAGEMANLKITEADDLKLCEAIVQSRKVVDTKDAIMDLFGDDE